MKLCFYSGGTTLDRETLLVAADADLGEDELWLLLALAADESLLADFESGADALADAVGLERSALDKALGFLLGAGILRREGARGRKKAAPKTAEKPVPKKEEKPTPRRAEVSELPKYTTDEFTEIMERRHELTLLIDEAQNALGKIFNQTEIRQLVSISEGLGLDDEYILLLLAYCRKQEKSNLRYAEKLALSFFDEGITTAEALTARLYELELAATTEGQIKRLFGFSRSLTGKEKGFLADWTAKFGFGADMIEKGYEIAVESTANPTLNYLHSILTRWHEEGIKTPEDADRDREARRNAAEGARPKSTGKPSPAPNRATSFDVDDFFAAAIGKGYGEKK